jgi:hypothetical protein
MKKILRNIFSEEHKRNIDHLGYCVFEPTDDLLDWLETDIDQLKLLVDKLTKEEGEKAGFEGREEYYRPGKKFEPIANRLGNLPNKSRSFFKFCTYPPILKCAEYLIKDEICVSSSNFREPLKNSTQQRLHIDWMPRKNQNDRFESAIAMLYLDDSYSLNGAIKVVPKSHRFTGFPDQYCNPFLNHKNEVCLPVQKGSILLLNSNLWHRGGANLDGSRRRIINVTYRQKNLPQGLNQKKYLNEKVITGMTYEEKKLFKVLESELEQKQKIVGPGDTYRQWLLENPDRNFSKSKNITIKHI